MQDQRQEVRNEQEIKVDQVSAETYSSDSEDIDAVQSTNMPSP